MLYTDISLVKAPQAAVTLIQAFALAHANPHPRVHTPGLGGEFSCTRLALILSNISHSSAPLAHYRGARTAANSRRRPVAEPVFVPFAMSPAATAPPPPAAKCGSAAASIFCPDSTADACSAAAAAALAFAAAVPPPTRLQPVLCVNLRAPTRGRIRAFRTTHEDRRIVRQRVFDHTGRRARASAGTAGTCRG